MPDPELAAAPAAPAAPQSVDPALTTEPPPGTVPPAWPSGDMGQLVYAAESQPQSRKRRGRVIGAVAGAAAVAGLAIGVTSTSGGSSATTTDVGEALAASVSQAIAEKSADVSLTLEINSPSNTINATGQGSVDFTTGMMQADMNIRVPASAFPARTEQVTILYAGAKIYEYIPQVGEIEPGRPWVELDVSSVARAQGGADPLQSGGNPLVMLELLRERGAAVSTLGTQSLDGVTVTHYHVEINQSFLQSSLSAMPAWVKSLARHESIANMAASEEVLVDRSGRLRETQVNISEDVGATPVTVTETMDFSNYGRSVSIVLPAASQVVPFQQFLKDAQAYAAKNGGS